MEMTTSSLPSSDVRDSIASSPSRATCGVLKVTIA